MTSDCEDYDVHSSLSEEEDAASFEDDKKIKRKRKNTSPNLKRAKTEIQQRTSTKKNNLYGAPTAEELNNLRETENLYNSNLFRFQIDGLLDEIKVKTKYITLFNNWVKQFDTFITNIPEYDGIKVSELNRQTCKASKDRTFKNLLIEHHKGISKTDQDLKIKFVKPEGYDIFELYKINLTLGPKLVVNVAIIMPKVCFLEKDYLNNRYVIKREYYLSYIFLEFRKSKLFSKLSYIHNNLVLEATLQICPNIYIHFHLIPSLDCFKLPRFHPNKNNVKADIFKDFHGLNLNELKQNGTAFYNSNILRDLTLKSHYDYFEEFLRDLTHIQDGVKLLLVWLLQRNLYLPVGSFSYELLLNLIVYLTKKRKINQYMSSYQVIRNVWIFLSTTNWHEQAISMCDLLSNDDLEKFKEYFDVVFIDTSGCYNLASFLNLEVYLKIRSEAKLAVEFLDEVKFDTFKALFLTKMEPELQYDALLRLSDTNHFEKIYESISPYEQFKYIGFRNQLLIRKIVNVLKKHLGKRLVNIVPLFSEDCSNSSNELTFGLTLEAENAFSIIEKGPQANTAEALEFRRFWGALSECRRFADGTICEAVYFKTNTVHEKRQILKKMIDFIVTNKFKVNHKILYDQFEETLILKNLTASFPMGTNEEASLKVITIFDELDAKIRDFKLPLEIADLRITSEIFCFTNPFPPVATVHKWSNKITSLQCDSIVMKEDCNIGSVPHYIEPVECVIQLGINSKWPKDLEVLRDIKTIYYLEISKLFKESGVLSRVNPDYLEVLYKGLVFRFQLYHVKEVALLKKVIKPDGSTAYKDNEESLLLEKNLTVLPKIIGALRGLHGQNNCYGISTTLIKRWLRTQLIDNSHIPDIVISLLNAHLFLQSTPFDRPNLPQVAFLRFVRFISGIDWNNQFILVNFNNELSKENIDSIQLSFEQNRQAYPLLHIVTPFDQGKVWFTKMCYKEILNRLKILANETLALLHNKIVKDMDFLMIQKLFIPNLNGYNVLIHLKSHLNPLQFQQLEFTNTVVNKVQIREFTEDEKCGIPVVSFNLIEKYLEDLRASYGNIALFFYDSYGGDTIGVLWKPSSLESKCFKASNIENGMELKGDELILNTALVIEDFRILGYGLVRDIVERK